MKGGLADKKTIEDIAMKHSQFVGTMKLALEKGIKVEKEHTSDKKVAEDIAMDHLWEDPDYYEKLEKMEKKKVESKEQTDASCSGSYEAPLSAPILKRDIKKLNEVADSSISAGAIYDAPIGHKEKDPLKIDNAKPTNGTIMGNKNIDKKSIAVTKPNFPKFGGPDSKFVTIDPATQKYPYRNQGDPKNSSLYEIKGMKTAVEEAAKKYGLSVKQVEEIILKESKQISEVLPRGMFDDANNKALRGWTDKGPKTIFQVKTELPLDIKTDDDIEVARLKEILYKHNIKFEANPLKDGVVIKKEIPQDNEDDEDIFGDDIFAKK